MQHLELRPDLTATTGRLSAPFAAELMASREPPQLIDVRTPREYHQSSIAGSLSIPLNHLSERMQDLQEDQPLLVYCAGGDRSSIAASLLQKKGFPRVTEIAGGMAAWEAAKLSVRSAQT
jgi:hydroxyacylglutathione hydrolase